VPSDGSLEFETEVKTYLLRRERKMRKNSYEKLEKKLVTKGMTGDFETSGTLEGSCWLP